MEKKSGIFTETFNKVLKPTFEQKKSKTKFFFFVNFYRFGKQKKTSGKKIAEDKK